MQTLLWESMMILGIIYAFFTKNISKISEAALNSTKEAVSLCIAMVGVMAFWCGMMEIAKEAGLIEAASKRMRPLLHVLFPRLPEHHPATEHISTNIIANVLGLGWAATPAGLKAMDELARLEDERRNLQESEGGRKGPEYERKRFGKRNMKARAKGVASNEMCTFLILNISSLQLIPVTVIAYRSQYGSVNPTAIVSAGILATLISTFAGVTFCKIMDRR